MKWNFNYRHKKNLGALGIIAFLLALTRCSVPQRSARESVINVDLNEKVGPMSPIWAWFGYDEPNYTYMPDGSKLLSEISKLSPVPVYVRTHNLLTTGDGIPALKWGSTNAYTEDDAGRPVYNWTIVDSIFNTFLSRGMRPLVEVGFMPEAMSSKPEPYKHKWKPGAPYTDIYTGWAYPPKDYAKWADLVYAWVTHCVTKYGKDEVEKWLWEVWNEPNIGYWQGTAEDYQKLYDYTVNAIKRALPTATVGGPDSTGPSWKKPAEFLKAFLNHVENGTNYATGIKGSPIDFIAFHAKGSSTLQGDSVVLMNVGTQLRDISRGFEMIRSFPGLKDKPVIIGESDPEGCAACSVKDYPANAYRNGTLYSSYEAEAFYRTYQLADSFHINLQGAVTWAFEFEGQPWFNGYRSLASRGIDKPVLNVFRMLGMMSGNRVKVSGDLAYDLKTVRDSSVRGDQPDVNVLAAVEGKKATVLVWNYRDLNIISPPSGVNIEVRGIGGTSAKVSEYRIDQHHSNAYTLWKSMGSPQHVSSAQYAALEKADKLELVSAPESTEVKNGTLTLTEAIEGQAVALFVVEW